MLFLATFGKNVEDAFGPIQYLLFYFAGGFVATMTQTTMTLLAGTAADAHIPTLGASGARSFQLDPQVTAAPSISGGAAAKER